MAVCITMNGEDELQLKKTLSAIIHDYNVMRADFDLNFKKEDFTVILICDDFDKLPVSFRDYATEKNFLDIELLEKKRFLEKDRDGILRMKDVRDLVDPGKKAPHNILHMF